MDYVNDADELGTLFITDSNDPMVAVGILLTAFCLTATVFVAATVGSSIILMRQKKRVFTSAPG